MAKDLDKLKKALREGEYSSVRASSQNQSQSTDYENDSEHLGSEVRVAIEEKPKKTRVFFIILSCILFALIILQWQSKNSEVNIELEKKEEQIRRANDQALQWQSKNSKLNIELEVMNSQIKLFQDEIDVLRGSKVARDQNMIEMLLKYESTNYGLLESGHWCAINFFGFAEGEWSNQKWSFNCVDEYGNMPSLRQGEFYVVSVCLVSDDAGYTEFGFCSARAATPQDRIDGSLF